MSVCRACPQAAEAVPVFGRFSARFLATPALDPGFTPRWLGPEAPDAARRAAIRLEAGNALLGAAEDGWHAFGGPEARGAVYGECGKARFALFPGPGKNEARALVSGPEWARAAAQFALLLALRRACVGLHGVTLLCGDEIVILSAPSGTGKTTLAGLLERHADAIVANGDFAMLSCDGPDAIFEPTPFCGSSGRALNRRLRADRIVFLEQAAEDRWIPLDGRAALRRFLENCFVPAWDGGLARAVRENAAAVLSRVKTGAFAFAPRAEAAAAFCEGIRGEGEPFPERKEKKP